MDSNKEEILSYFQGFLTAYKIALFEQKVLERTRHYTFILEDLFHPHNASAILRSCDCFGIQDIHMIENNHRFKNEKDISLGSKKWLSLHHYNDHSKPDATCIDQLKAKGYTIAALSPHHDDISINDLPLDKKVAFVLGAEKTGLTTHSLENADLHVKIPMYGFTESLNVSVTAALTMYDVTQRMRRSSIDWQLSLEEQWQLKMIWTLRSIRSTRDIVKHYLQSHPEASAHFEFSEFLQ